MPAKPPEASLPPAQNQPQHVMLARYGKTPDDKEDT